MYHPGVAEAKHAPEPDVRWFAEDGCSPAFVKNLKTGGFVACGNSGSVCRRHARHPEYAPGFGPPTPRLPDGDGVREYGCCFFDGSAGCFDGDSVLRRRWTCCKRREIVGTIADLDRVPGCTPCGASSATTGASA